MQQYPNEKEVSVVDVDDAKKSLGEVMQYSQPT